MYFSVKEKVECYQVDYSKSEVLKTYCVEFPVIIIHSLGIIFAKSKSKYYSKAYNIAKLLNCEIKNEMVYVFLEGNASYCKYYFRINKLLSIISNWKNTIIELNGKKITYNDYKILESFVFSNYYEYLEDNEMFIME